MTPVLLAFAALLGLVVGSFLNVVIARVPARRSLLPASRCPRCEAPIRPRQNIPVLSWLLLRGRCARCSAPISLRYPLVELSGTALFALLAWGVLAGHFPGTAHTPAATVVFAAYAWFAAAALALALIDLDTQRLPDAIVLPSIAVVAVLLSLAALLAGELEPLLRAALGGAVLFAFYWLLAFLRPGGMGGGDVKLAALVGLVLGWMGWGALIVGAFSAFLLGGLFGVALLLRHRAGRRTAIPFGPWMLLGAAVGITGGEQIAQGYLRTVGISG